MGRSDMGGGLQLSQRKQAFEDVSVNVSKLWRFMTSEDHLVCTFASVIDNLLINVPVYTLENAAKRTSPLGSATVASCKVYQSHGKRVQSTFTPPKQVCWKNYGV